MTDHNRRSNDLRDTPPICGRCGATMNSRPGNNLFCASCIEYGQYTGVIHPTSPVHPVFEDILCEDPELIVGMMCIRYPYQGNEDPVGTIAAYDADTGEYLIESDFDEPFDRTQRYIERETLREFLWTPDGPDDRQVPDELSLGVRKR